MPYRKIAVPARRCGPRYRKCDSKLFPHDSTQPNSDRQKIYQTTVTFTGIQPNSFPRKHARETTEYGEMVTNGSMVFLLCGVFGGRFKEILETWSKTISRKKKEETSFSSVFVCVSWASSVFLFFSFISVFFSCQMHDT